MMKTRAMVWVMALSCTLGGMVARGDAITGKSSPFRVDTRCKKFLIEDVKSAFCSGAYGMKGGKRATFLNGIPADVDFTVSVQGNDIPVERVTVNGKDFTGASFTYDMGTLPSDVCGPLVVVAHGTVEGLDVASEPFRVNLDVARLPVAADWIWEGANGWYKRPDKNPLFMFPVIEEVVDLGNTALGFAGVRGNVKLPLAFDRVPTLTFTESFEVEKGEYTRTAGGGGTIGRFKGGKINAIAGGAFRDGWEPENASWSETSSDVWMEVKIDDVGLTWYPFSPFIGLYISGTFFGNGRMDIRWNHHEDRLFYEEKFDPLIGFKGATGMGWRNVEGIGVYGSAGVSAKLSTEDPFELAIDIKAGCEYSDLEAGEIGQEIEYYSKHISLLPKKTETEVYLKERKPEIWKRLRAQMCKWPMEEPGLVCTPNGSAQVCLGTVGESPARAEKASMPVFSVAIDTADGRAEETPWADETPDSSPCLGADAEGRLFAVWVNARTPLGEEATDDEVLGAQEIAAAVRDPVTGVWTARNLTDNAVLDGMPVLAVGEDGVAFAAWIQNGANVMEGTMENPSRLLASRWMDGAWSEAEGVATVDGVCGTFDLAAGNGRAVLVWSADAGGDDGTESYCELHAATWDGTAWGEERAITENEVADFAPKAFFGTNGLYSVVWNRGGEWVMGEEGAFGAAAPIPFPERMALPGAVSLASAGEGRTAIMWSLVGEVLCMVYDQGSGEWTAPAAVAAAASGKELLSFGAAFDAEGNVLIATEETSVAVDDEGKMTAGESSVVRSVFGNGADPAVFAEDFAFAANEVVAGELTPIVTTVRNLGLEGMTNVTVRFWVCDGELEESVAARCELWGESGEMCVVDLPGGAAVVVTNQWMVEDFRTNLTFVAQIEVPEGAADRDMGNNAAVWRPGAAELRLEGGRCEAVGVAVRLLTATVRNGGLAAAEAGTVVSFRLGAPDGEEVGRDVAGVVLAGEGHGYDAGVAWDMSGGSWTGAWVTVYAVMETGEASEAVPIRVMTPLDRDGDGLLDGEESAMGTDPLKTDTNGDGVSDYDHVYVWFTDPLAGMGAQWTTNTPVKVPFTWLEQYAGALAEHGGDHEAFAADTAANGRPVWECYVADLDPTDEEDELRVALAWDEESEKWVPQILSGRKEERTYEFEGAERMPVEGEENQWGEVEEGSRFFRVKVALP